jgi:hypothetical protein
MIPKTEAEQLEEQLQNPNLPSPEEAAKFYEDRIGGPPIGSDAEGNIQTFNSKADIPADFFDVTIVGEDDDPGDISDINDWDDI